MPGIEKLRPASRTKIVATTGPACSSKEVLRQMILEGIDIFRINFSHGSRNEHLMFIQFIHELNEESGTNVAILVDLQGPKLRIGDIMNNELVLKQGDIINFVTDDFPGTMEKIKVSYHHLAEDVNPGEYMLVDDGKIKFRVLATNGKDKVTAEVLNDGILLSRKGLNLPDTIISTPGFTDKDREDTIFALRHGVDYIALSFVRKSDDILLLRRFMEKEGGNAGIIAKIEKPDALNDLDKIIDISDGIMVARGDLGVEVDFEKVPLIQKEIIAKCMVKSKPVIVATQMMESMITGFRPSRAEATDVANAVLDGADALMLSGETSIGHDPILVIRSMHQIVTHTEENAYHYYTNLPPDKSGSTFFADSICFIAANLAKQTEAKGIVCFTHSGLSAFQLAAQRPRATIFALTANKALIPKLSLIWGVQPVLFEEYSNIESAIKASVEKLSSLGYVSKDDTLVHLGSIPQNLKGRANMVRLSTV